MAEVSQVNIGKRNITDRPTQILPYTESETIFEYLAYKVCEVFCTTGVIDRCSQRLLQGILADGVRKEALPKKTELLLSVATICGLLVDLKEGKLYPSLVTSCMPIFQYFLEEVECSKDLMLALLRLISLQGQGEGQVNTEQDNAETGIEQESLEEVEIQMSEFVKMVLDKIGKPILSRIVAKMNFYESEVRNDLVASQAQRKEQLVDDGDSESQSMEVDTSKEEIENIGQDLQGSATDGKQETSQPMNLVQQGGSEEEGEPRQALEKQGTCTGLVLADPSVWEDTGCIEVMRGTEREEDSNIPQEVEGDEVDHSDAMTVHNTKRHLRIELKDSKRDLNCNVLGRGNSCGSRSMQCEVKRNEDASDPEETMMESTNEEEEFSDNHTLHEEDSASLQSSCGLLSSSPCVFERGEASKISDLCQQNSVSSSQDDRRRSSKELRERKNIPDDVSDVASSSGEPAGAQVVTSGQPADPGGQTLEWSSDDDISESDHCVSLAMATMRTRGKKRRAWSYREIRNLRQGVEHYGAGHWSEILSSYDFDDRSAVDLKDKWRNLNK